MAPGRLEEMRDGVDVFCLTALFQKHQDTIPAEGLMSNTAFLLHENRDQEKIFG